ncbi:OmpH family outer membrane protein [Roseovarius sp. MBR-6]|uniref:OmpH family outer membrane protein n=1 Tax=Roseovarius sp. MBR-6 TaxID=3156459 RepID=UPI0033934E87
MRALVILLSVLAIFGGTGGHAQQLGVVQSDVLVIDIDRLLNESAYGRRLQADIEAARDNLIARNERVAAELEAEERTLTEQRATMAPEAFRDMANAFDEKVSELRRESETLSRDLERRRDLAPIQFMRVVQPVLGEVLTEADAAVLLDVRSVILRAEVADITDLAIARIDARIGSGPVAPPPLTESEDNLAPVPPQ